MTLEQNLQQEWDSNRAADGCRFCLPRDGIDDFMIEISRLAISTLYLEKIQTYRGHCVLLFDPRHVTRIDELSAAEWQQLSADIRAAELALIEVFNPDHINIASLGQVVPHLHWHIVPRYCDDPRWGGPIWTTTAAEMQKIYLDTGEYLEIAASIRQALADD